VAKADSLGRNPEWVPKEKWFDSAAQEWFIKRVRELEIERKPPKPILMGRHLIDLGLAPSTKFSEILDAVYELQLDGNITCIEEAKEAAVKMMKKINT
jgi:tRNA nucleotidyltransferase (CCA-adding enzyme)